MSNTPQQITFDLDAQTRAPEDVKEPFVVNVRGRAITMTDPENFDWQDLLLIQNPNDFLRFCISDDDRIYLRGLTGEHKIEGWRFGKLMEAYQRHYELDKKAEQYQQMQQRQANGF